MPARTSDETAVRVHCDKTEERSVQIFIPYERFEFSEKKNSCWRRPLLPEMLGQLAPSWNEIADFEPIFALSASAVTPSEKSSINTNRKSTTRFLMSPRWTSYVVPKPPKNKTAVCSLKSYFAWRKSATKFLCVKTVSDKLVGHSLD